MAKLRLFSWICIALASLSLLGCQGGSSSPDTPDDRFTAGDSNPAFTINGKVDLTPVHPPQSWLAQGQLDDVRLPQGVTAPAAPRQVNRAGHPALDLAKLPPLPQPDANGADPHGRKASAMYTIGLSDVNYLVEYGGGALPVGSSLSLSPAAGGLAYAIYKVELNPTEMLTNFSITAITSARLADYSRHGLWIGISDYTLNSWVFPDTLENPPSTFENPTDIMGNVIFSWPATGHTFINPANLTTYIMLGAQDGDNVSVSSFAVATSGGLPGTLPPEWNEALTNAGLTSNGLGMQPIFDPTDANLLTPDNFAWNTPWVDIRTILPLYWKQWYYGKETVKMPDAINAKRDTVRQTDSIQDLLLSAIAEFPVDQQSPAQTANVTLAAGDPLANAIADFVTAVGGTPDLPTYIAALAPMIDANQRALARVVKGSEKAWTDRHAWLYGTGGGQMGFDDATLQVFFEGTHPYWLPSPDKPAGYAPVYMINDGGVSGNMYYMRAFPYVAAFFPEACYLADTIDQLTAYMKTNPTWENVSLNVDTPAGKIVIGGTGDDTHAATLPNGHAILIDLGGNDTYNCHAGGTASALNGVAVTIDLAGDDIYNAMDDPLNVRNPPDDETCQQGAARYGIGMLVDYAGKDDYSCVRMGQGSAVMGVGVLADFGGDDNYEGEALVQGAAYGGVGLLYDKTGSDDYSAWSMGQGFGGIMGVGFLVDQGNGDDMYIAVPDYDASRPEYASAQDAAYNANFCQGAGFGKRWNGDGSTDPIVAAGGLGLLYDGGGMDTFNCGIFGEAVGFFHSLGVLIDDDDDTGLDTYHGIWYVQGATAHTACAFFWEGGGSDSYWSRSSIAIGGAHDWSVTWFMDRGGNDTYNGSGLSLGTGYNSGQGFFIDMGGNDSYNTDNCDGTFETLGRGGWPATGRETEPSIGIFVDAGGTDVYSTEYAGMLAGNDGANPGLLVATPPADGASWVRINGDSTDAGLAGMGFYPLGIGSGVDSGT